MAVTNVKTYQAFRGVDVSTSPAVISDEHASDMRNMYIGADGLMQKRPGWRVLHEFKDGDISLPINGIHYVTFGDGIGMLFIHAGRYLYSVMMTPKWRHTDEESGDVPFFRTAADVPTSADATRIDNYVTGSAATFEPWQVKNMDFNGDGRVSQEDASLIRRYIASSETASNGVLNSSYTRIAYADESVLELANSKSVAFEHDGSLYLIDGLKYYRIYPLEASGNTFAKFAAEEVVGYVPTTAVGGYYKYDPLNNAGTNTPGSASNPGVWQKPELFEERNLLQTKQINTFIADGRHTNYYLFENNTVVDKVEFLWKRRCKNVNGVDTITNEEIDIVPTEGESPVTGEYYYYAWVWVNVARTHATYAWTVTQATNQTLTQNEISYTTKIHFNTAPPAQDEGLANIRVTYHPRKHSTDKAIAEDRAHICKATAVVKFGYFNNNRFFFGGIAGEKHTDYYSAVDDPTYIPANGWTKIGSELSEIQGYLRYGSELAIIKEDNGQDATVYMRSAEVTEDAEVIFPVKQGAQGAGAISKWCMKTLNDEPLFLAKEGVYAIEGTDTTQERAVPNRSYYIGSLIKAEASKDCVAETFMDYYILCNPATGHCFVADARRISDQYDWCLWDNIYARVLKATDTQLFFGTQDGKLCIFNFDWEDPHKYSDGAVFIEGSTEIGSSSAFSDGDPIDAYYVTKRDHLGALDFKKTILNDGGFITLRPQEQSSASITVKTDKGEWFVDQIQTDSDEPSVVIPIRHRFKNFDSIETRIENKELDEGIALIGVQYRYVITTNRR